MKNTQSKLSSFTPRFDEGAHPVARIGFISVANAGLSEYDMFAMSPKGIGLHFTRVKMSKETTISNLASTESEIDNALDTLMPGRDDVDVISYNCTSGSLIIGEDAIKKKIEDSRTNVIGTTMLTGVVNALETMGIKKLSIGTAYTKDIDELEKDYFESKGFDVLNIHGLGLLTGLDKNKVTTDCLIEFATLLDHPEADAIFLSCGALRAVEVIEEVERILNKPVITSNQASLWNCLRLAGVKEQIKGYGRLFEEY